jgi:hypothetical protein
VRAIEQRLRILGTHVYSVRSLTRKKSKITRMVANVGTAKSTPVIPARDPPARTPRKIKRQGGMPLYLTAKSAVIGLPVPWRAISDRIASGSIP